MIKTEKEISHYRLVKSKEDPEELEPELLRSETVTQYRFASLDDITEDMRPGSPCN